MTVYEEKSSEEPELRDGVIGRIDGLKTFFTRDTHSDVCGLNHADVVSTVTDSKGHDTEVVFDKSNNLRFLQWRDSATNDGGTLCGEMQQ